MISVIVPTYNRAPLLRRALESILCQQLPPGEVIVVDDGSTDQTAELVAALARSSDIPLHYHHQENQGAAAARNTGIQASRFPLLCFLDSDDWWHPAKLARQYQAMEAEPGYQISHTREVWYRRGKRVNQKKKHDPPHGDIFAQSLRMCVVGMSTVMIRKGGLERFGCFDRDLICCEDYDLWLRMACQIPFLLVGEPLIFKDGGRPDQLSAIHRLGMDVYRIHALCKLLEGGRLDSDQYELAKAELARKCRIYGNGCLKHGRLQQGQDYLALAQAY
ncbi:glycosyltransferase family 2 protein [Desulfogranum mediterraneum]|uniref:glycosyltransferase family 2 protein n=1 Tax=Desulfogranum mediterraneum TaxID=160661 RepID=UPI00042749B5|nr:glycosyltransferase family A protein [Desulfogranum mediterraneum]